MSDHLANFLIAAESLLTPWFYVTVFGILVTIAAYYAYLDKRDRERIERERESSPYFTTETDDARAEMRRRADVARAAREAAERRMRGAS